jgi:hypothetical protein
MNKLKISKILGVGLALVMVFSLMVGFMPAQKAEAQAYTPNQWNTMPIPSAAGSVLVPTATIRDFVVAKDGKTIYLLNTAGGAGARVAKSTNAGRTFTFIADPVAGTAPSIIAVAPDDPNVVAVVVPLGGGTDTVWTSINGGATWAPLGDPSVGGTTTEVLSCLAVGPAVAGTLLGRHYVVGSYDTTNVTSGDIYVCGDTAVWLPQGVAVLAAVPLFDFTSLALAPNWIGERTIIAIGSDNVAGGTAEIGAATVGDTRLVAVNIRTPALGPVLAGPGTVRLDTTVTDSPSEINAGFPGNGQIRFSSVVLPYDFDSTSVGNFRAFVGWTSTTTGGLMLCADDAYRVDFNSVRKLEIRPPTVGFSIYSLSYAGVVASGTLFAGESDTTAVWVSNDPQSGLPSWQFSYKPPTGTNAAATSRTVVRVAPDYSAANKVAYASSFGANNAFSVSSDGGLSFNGISIINLTTAIVSIFDVMPTADGSYLFMVTNDAAGGTGNKSLWRCPGTPTIGGWDRVDFRLAAQFPGAAPIIRLSPDNDAVYLFDAGAGGLGGLGAIRKSTNNGQIWSSRTPPTAAITDAAVESKDVLYVIETTNVWATTTGAWNFGLPINPTIGALVSIQLAPSFPSKPVAGTVVVGAGAGAVALSTNSAASFSALLNFTALGNMIVYADKNYATNSTIYVGDSTTAGGGIYRYKVGTSSAWEQILAYADVNSGTGAVAGVCLGLAMLGNELYAEAHGTGPALPSSAYRAFFPTAPAPLWTWDQLDVGPGATAAQSNNMIFNVVPLRICGSGTNVFLYAANSAAGPPAALMCYNDTMTLNAAAVTIPATVNYDPNSNGNKQFTISWKQISNALSYHAEIYSDAGCTQFVARAWGAGAAGPIIAYTPADPSAPSWVVPAALLSAGQDYWFKARACDQTTGDAIRSKWSDKIKFTVEVGVPISVTYPSPELLAPRPGATDVTLRPGFSWGGFYGATSYEFELATNPGITAGGYFVDALVGLTGTNALTTTAWQCDKDLKYATNYYYHVKAITASGATPWSTGTFTTITAGVFTCPLDGLTFATQAELQAHNAVAHAPVIPQTPAYIWAVVIIGAILVIVVIALIFTTRRVS